MQVDQLVDLFERRLGGFMLVRLELAELLERLTVEESELATLLQSILHLRDKERAQWNQKLAEARAYARQLELELAQRRTSFVRAGFLDSGGSTSAADETDPGAVSAGPSERSTPAHHGGPYRKAIIFTPAGSGRRLTAIDEGICSHHSDKPSFREPAQALSPSRPTEVPHAQAYECTPALEYEDIAEKLEQRLTREHQLRRASAAATRAEEGAPQELEHPTTNKIIGQLRASMPSHGCSAPAGALSQIVSPRSAAVVAPDGSLFQFSHLEP